MTRLPLFLLLLAAIIACDGGSPGPAGDAAAPVDAPAPGRDAVSDAPPVPDTAPDLPAGPPWTFVPPPEPLVVEDLAEGLPAATEGLVFDGQGTLYVSAGDGWVYAISPDGSWAPYAELLPVEGASGDVAGMGRDPAGALYVCRYTAGRIERIVPGDPPVVTVFAEGLDHPNSVAFDPAGVLWYTASGKGAAQPGHVGRLLTGGVPEPLIPDIVYANGLAFSPGHDRVWFTSTEPGSLLWAPLGPDGLPDGDVVVAAEGPDLLVADGLAVAPDGTVFVAGFGTGRIYAFTADGLLHVADAALGVASLALGAGPGFSPTALYATNLLQPRVVTVELASP
ncbi:MAG: SMP-30/gluconolactonase/LRE family protein [Deltaproteobacteria bacterium]|nr:SMP-30/gluconolactonase/LRE family protein [Deltaproteobacteria bacterium]